MSPYIFRIFNVLKNVNKSDSLMLLDPNSPLNSFITLRNSSNNINPLQAILSYFWIFFFSSSVLPTFSCKISYYFLLFLFSFPLLSVPPILKSEIKKDLFYSFSINNLMKSFLFYSVVTNYWKTKKVVCSYSFASSSDCILA